MAILAGIVALLSGGGGFYAGKRWYEGGQLRAVERQHAKDMETLQEAWLTKWDEAQAELKRWQDQAALDAEIIKTLRARELALLAMYEDVRNEHEKIEDFGHCVLSDDAYRLLDYGQLQRRDNPTP
jgi:hypothetical protein